MSSRAGHYEPQVGGYKAFIPATLPPRDLVLDERLWGLLSNAAEALGRLDGAVAILPDTDLFVSMYVKREAVLSSQIEGTHASLMDVLEYEAEQERGEASVDLREIWNYVRAMNHGLSRLPDLPLSRRLLCEVHAILMKDVRGGEPHKTPGEVRRSQNWIGGASPTTARFVPPPPDAVGEAFADLEAFLHDTSPMPSLLKAGIAHAQFETIHPYLDGNGRLGRLLITFWLVEQGRLRRPVIYPSLFFKEHKDEYVARLQAVRDDGGWEEWLAFFLDGMSQAAVDATTTAMRIMQLREADRALIADQLGRKTARGLTLLDHLYRQPTITASQVEQILEVSQPTASALVADFERIGIFNELTGRRKWRVFKYERYLALFSGIENRE